MTSKPPNTPRAISEAFSEMSAAIAAKFTNFQRVKIIGKPEIYTVQVVRQEEPRYHIQLGSDFATRIWARESELESAE